MLSENPACKGTELHAKPDHYTFQFLKFTLGCWQNSFPSVAQRTLRELWLQWQCSWARGCWATPICFASPFPCTLSFSLTSPDSEAAGVSFVAVVDPDPACMDKFHWYRGGGVDLGDCFLMHLQCWEALPFLIIQRQRCVKFRVLRAQDFYILLALNYQQGQHLPALEVYKKQSPKISQDDPILSRHNRLFEAENRSARNRTLQPPEHKCS